METMPSRAPAAPRYAQSWICGAHRDGISALAEYFLIAFVSVISLTGSSTVGIDIIDIFDGQAAVFERRLHGTDSAGRLFIGSGLWKESQ